MNQTEPKFIGKRIRVLREKGAIQIEINQKIERWQEAMLFMWITAWTFCGGAFLYYAFNASNQSEQIFFIISSSLWLFFFIRITKVFLWRLIGKEIIQINREGLSIRNAFGSCGRFDTYSQQWIVRKRLRIELPKKGRQRIH
jgi:hypothetical protein